MNHMVVKKLTLSELGDPFRYYIDEEEIEVLSIAKETSRGYYYVLGFDEGYDNFYVHVLDENVERRDEWKLGKDIEEIKKQLEKGQIPDGLRSDFMESIKKY